MKKKVKEILDQFDELHWDMPPANMYGNAGRHDFIICQRGLFWTVETKAGKNKPTTLQESFAKDVINARGLSIWVNEHNFAAVKTVATHIELEGRLPDYYGMKNFWTVQPGYFDAGA